MDRRILVTGGTSGIGRALAFRLAGGARLLLTGRRPAEAAAELIPPDAAYVVADQCDPERAARAVAAAMDALGWDRLDAAILNAGLGRVGPPQEESAAALRETLDADLMAPVAIAHALFPRLEAARGTLVLVGSTARRGAPAFASYAAAKAGLHGLGRALAEEWRGRVAVRVVHPGPTATALHARAGYDPGRTGALFAAPETMAALVEKAMEAHRPVATLSFGRVLAWRLGRLGREA